MSKPNTTFTRRGMLVGGAAALGSGALILLLQQLSGGEGPLADSYAARSIGARFAARYPQPEALWRGSTPESPADWQARVRQLINEDLEANRLVQVDGWWLAETEVLLCVLAYVAGQ